MKMNKENYYLLGKTLAKHVCMRTSFSTMDLVSIGAGPGLYKAAASMFGSEQVCEISPELAKYITEHETTPIKDIQDTLALIRDNAPSVFEVITRKLKDQVKRERNGIAFVEGKGKIAYERDSRYVLAQMHIGIETANNNALKAYMAAIVEGFVTEYSNHVRLKVDAKVLSRKIIEDGATPRDFLVLAAELQIDAKTMAEILVTALKAADSVELFGSVIDISQYLEVVKVLEGMANEELVVFVTNMMEVLHLNDVPMNKIGEEAQKQLSVIQAMQLISDMPEAIASSSITSILTSQVVESSMKTHFEKGSYHLFLGLMESIGEILTEEGLDVVEANSSSDVKIAKAIELIRSMGQEEINALEKIQLVLTNEKATIDDLPVLYDALQKIETSSSIVKRILALVLNAKAKEKVDYLLDLQHKIGKQTVEDIVFIVKASESTVTVRRNSDSGAGSDSEAERRDSGASSVDELSQKPGYKVFFERLKRLSAMSDAQALAISECGLLSALIGPDLLANIRSISGDLCDKMLEITEITLAISEAQDQIKATFMAFKKFSGLTPRERKIVYRTLSSIGVSMPVEWADSEVFLRANAISEPLYDEIEAIRDESTYISQADDPKKATFLLFKRIARLSVGDRYNVIQFVNSLGGAIPEAWCTSEVLSTMSRMSDELYDAIEEVRIDISSISEAENRAVAILNVMKKVSDIDSEDRKIVIEVLNAILGSEMAVELADLAVLQGLEALPQELQRKFNDIIVRASAISGSDDKVRSICDLIESVDQLTDEEWTKYEEIRIIIQGPDVEVADVGLYGKILEIADILKAEADIVIDEEDEFMLIDDDGNELVDENDDDFVALPRPYKNLDKVLLALEKISELTPEEKQTSEVLVQTLVGRQPAICLDQLFTLSTLMNENNVGKERLKNLIVARRGNVDRISRRVNSGTSHPLHILYNVYKGSIAVHQAKDIFMVIALISMTASVLFAGAAPYAMIAMGAALLNVIGRFAYDLYYLNDSNTAMGKVTQALMEDCHSVGDAVDFISVFLNEEDNNPDRNHAMVEAAKTFGQDVRMCDFGPMIHGVADDIGPDIRRTLSR